MNFVTLEFVCFFVPTLLLLRYTRSRPTWHLPALVLCNLCFYAATGLYGLTVLAATTVLAWGGGRLLGPESRVRHPRRWLWGAIAACLCMLAFFKYSSLLLTLLHALTSPLSDGTFAKSLLEHEFAYIAGISFFIFQAVSYLVDVYRGKEPPAGFLQVAAWLSFFPLVMSGPITRAGEFMPQIASPEEDTDTIEEGVLLILAGLFKKVVLSSYLAEHAVRQVFAAPESCSSLAVAVGLYSYSIQIYCDFSGYTDLALGIACLLGYRLPPNFDAPYLALNIQDFWRRWHMTLSRWFKDYVYIPLGGSRSGNVHVNLLLTMLLCGIWHGSGAGFLVWGGLHGLGLCVHRAFVAYRQGYGGAFFQSRLSRILTWLATMHFVTLLWVFFRADTLDNALSVLARLFAFTDAGDGFALFALPAIVFCLLMQYMGPRVTTACRTVQRRMPWYAQGIAAALLVTLVFCMGPDGVLPFIYFGF